MCTQSRCWCNTRKFIRLGAPVLGYQRSIVQSAVSRGVRWHPCSTMRVLRTQDFGASCLSYVLRIDSPSRTEKGLFHSRTKKNPKHARKLSRTRVECIHCEPNWRTCWPTQFLLLLQKAIGCPVRVCKTSDVRSPRPSSTFTRALD